MEPPSMVLAMIHDLQTSSKSKRLFFVKGRQIASLSEEELSEERMLADALQASGKDSFTWIEQTFDDGQTIHIKVVEIEGK